MKHVIAAALAAIVGLASLATVASACPLKERVTETTADEAQSNS